MERNSNNQSRNKSREPRRGERRDEGFRGDNQRKSNAGRRGTGKGSGEEERKQGRPFRSDSPSRASRGRRDFQSDEKRGGFRRQNSDERPRRQRNDDEGIIRMQKSGLVHSDDAMKMQPTRKKDDGLIRLNKYIANAGICSRREADDLIAAGSVTVNGKVVTEMGFKVKPTDVVAYGGETLRSERKRYFLLNKPKGFITTVDDPHERQTVMMLIDGACSERIYPVGRLDRQTTGLLLFTNDGELARRLTHPSTGVYKIYHVELNKPLDREDMQRILNGIELEDGPIHADDVQYVEGLNDKRVVGVALHSGKNRIVRRIFEHLGYEIHKLDRVVFAGLTKKDLPRGRYRELTEKEVAFLKMV